MDFPYSEKFYNYLKYEKKLEENSIYAYYNDVKEFFTFLEDSKEVNKIEYNDILEFVIYLHEKENNNRSIARKISGLKNYFVFLMKMELIEVNPVADFERPNYEKKLPEFLTLPEIEMLVKVENFDKADDVRDSCIIEFLYSCGLRASELTNLKISDVSFEMKILNVIGKGNKQRLIPIGSIAFELLKIYLYKARVRIAKKYNSTDYLFISKLGKKLSRVSIWEIVKKRAMKRGITKNIYPHTLRHSFATHLLSNGADIRVVQELLGHSSITTTEIYTHVTNELLRKEHGKFHPLEKELH
ncbi:MAG: site-specific tyrosine recombinase XerD [Brevinematales bacterium]|nr:site-specific tyrosine recombinase XerD [Brevinematales bacterium]